MNNPKSQKNKKSKKVAIIVAHPDDETLWAGGTILSHNDWECFIISMCRANDENRAPKFYETLKLLNAKGTMGNLDDGPEQKPLTEDDVEKTILDLLPIEHFDLIITHNPLGEYTKHLRHEEVGEAVINLWKKKEIKADALWVFAYEDGNKAYFPQPIQRSNLYIQLPQDIWQKKYNIITQTYGFGVNTFEAMTTPKGEAFSQFTDAIKAKEWLENCRYISHSKK
jgi:LmbE family N-acetylglucosaminyl deacetylase